MTLISRILSTWIKNLEKVDQKKILFFLFCYRYNFFYITFKGRATLICTRKISLKKEKKMFRYVLNGSWYVSGDYDTRLYSHILMWNKIFDHFWLKRITINWNTIFEFGFNFNNIIELRKASLLIILDPNLCEPITTRTRYRTEPKLLVQFRSGPINPWLNREHRIIPCPSPQNTYLQKKYICKRFIASLIYNY